MICMKCEKELTKQEIKKCQEKGIIPLCDECFKYNNTMCELCGEVPEYEELFCHEDTGILICEKCLDERFFKCPYCEKYVEHENFVYVDSEDRYICQECISEWYRECNECGSLVHIDYLMYINEDEQLCEHCYAEKGTIRNYSYKPKWKFYDLNEKHPLYMGVELEIDKIDGNYDEQNKLVGAMDNIFNGKAIFKHDGSLGQYGFEIVSHPATLKFHKECMYWSDIFDLALEFDYASNDINTCGLHITVEKPSEIEVAKLVLFFELHWDKILKISRRTKAQYKEWADRYFSNNEEISLDKVQDKIKNIYDRYRAINVSKIDVIEFRIFKGTLNDEIFYATLEFIHNLMKFVKDTNVTGIINNPFSTFIEWCEEYGETEYMIDYFKEIDLI